ncbi:MAG: putative transcriptional regulator [Myxococcaceae bacterium]|nr:putative transcriptional regulator [Myxococcaceae bacterium]
MTGPRSYGDACGIARALDVIGERWALLIVRELAYGPKRFGELRGSLALSPNVLSQRLSELEASGVIERRQVVGGPYDLTPWGRELHPLLLQLGRWGARTSQKPQGELSAAALMLALEATFTPSHAADLRASYELRLDEERFAVDVRDARLTVSRGSPRAPDAIIETDPATLRALAFGDRKLAGSAVKMQGDAHKARAFFRLFTRPT